MIHSDDESKILQSCLSKRTSNSQCPLPILHLKWKASLVYRNGQNLEFLLQKKLKYFDIPFVLNQGMKSASFRTKQ